MVRVLFNEPYTVKNQDKDRYEAGQVYEMTPEQARLFGCWCDCEVLDRTPASDGPRPVAKLDPETQAKAEAARKKYEDAQRLKAAELERRRAAASNK